MECRHSVLWLALLCAWRTLSITVHTPHHSLCSYLMNRDSRSLAGAAFIFRSAPVSSPVAVEKPKLPLEPTSRSPRSKSNVVSCLPNTVKTLTHTETLPLTADLHKALMRAIVGTQGPVAASVFQAYRQICWRTNALNINGLAFINCAAVK